MNIRPFLFYIIPFNSFTVFARFCPFWGRGRGPAICLWEVNLVVILQRPMTSLMLVMSQHSVLYMFHEVFETIHLSNKLYMNFQCNLI